jgi:zinc-ribbon domain
LEIFMFCPACGNKNVPGSVTCSKCGAAFPASHATSPPKVSAAAQSNPETVPSAAQTKAEQSKAAPLIAGAALAGMGDRAIATILDLVVAGAVFALVGMWAAVRWGGVASNGLELHGTAAVVAFDAVPDGPLEFLISEKELQ